MKLKYPNTLVSKYDIEIIDRSSISRQFLNYYRRSHYDKSCCFKEDLKIWMTVVFRDGKENRRIKLFKAEEGIYKGDKLYIHRQACMSLSQAN